MEVCLVCVLSNDIMNGSIHTNFLEDTPGNINVYTIKNALPFREHHCGVLISAIYNWVCGSLIKSMLTGKGHLGELGETIGVGLSCHMYTTCTATD